MAARLGGDGNRQALADFITTSPWDPVHIRARLAWRMETAIGPKTLNFDDTGFLKDGSLCPMRSGVRRRVLACPIPPVIEYVTLGPHDASGVVREIGPRAVHG
jgi:hypothetical protein